MQGTCQQFSMPPPFAAHGFMPQIWSGHAGSGHAKTHQHAAQQQQPSVRATTWSVPLQKDSTASCHALAALHGLALTRANFLGAFMLFERAARLVQVLHGVGVAVEEAGRGEHAEGHGPCHGQEGVRVVRVHLRPHTPSSARQDPRHLLSHFFVLPVQSVSRMHHVSSKESSRAHASCPRQ